VLPALWQRPAVVKILAPICLATCIAAVPADKQQPVLMRLLAGLFLTLPHGPANSETGAVLSNCCQLSPSGFHQVFARLQIQLENLVCLQVLTMQEHMVYTESAHVLAGSLAHSLTHSEWWDLPTPLAPACIRTLWPFDKPPSITSSK